MAKMVKSKGAAYVKQLPLVVHSMDAEPTGPTLFWSETCSIYYDGNGSSRPIYGLPLREAYELCKLKSVELRIQTRSYRP